MFDIIIKYRIEHRGIIFFNRCLLILILFNSPYVLKAQNGCTDSTANNFDPGAKHNNGACIYNPENGKPVLMAPLKQISESSGLVYSDGRLWTFGDSGNPAEIFSVDTATGSIIQTVHIRNYPNTDWEDITADSDYLYISDLGNNTGDRTDLEILKIAKHDIGSAAAVSVSALAINIAYNDQSDFSPNDHTNFDCEAILSMGDSLYLFSKDRGDLQTRVYAVSKTPGTYRLSPYTSYNVNGEITGADFNPATREAVLIGYMGSKLNSFIWILDDFQDQMFFSGNKRRIEIGNNSLEWQTEGICFIDPTRVFISCESTPDIGSSLYSLDLRQLQDSAVITSLPEKASEGIFCYPNPVNDFINLHSNETILSVTLKDMEGVDLLDSNVNSSSYQIDLSQPGIKNGLYLLEIRETDYMEIKKIMIRR